jgi:hypothetical protein
VGRRRDTYLCTRCSYVCADLAEALWRRGHDPCEKVHGTRIQAVGGGEARSTVSDPTVLPDHRIEHERPANGPGSEMKHRLRRKTEVKTARRILGSALMIVVFAVAYASAQQETVDVKSLAGKWAGFASPPRGSNVPLQVEVKPDGSYTSKWGSTAGKGVIKMDGGKLVAEGNLISGTGTAAAGVGKSELTVTSKDGKQRISGSGRDQEGPYNFELTKQ